MGGGPAVLLIALPVPVPDAIVTRLSKKFPHLEIKTVQVTWFPSAVEVADKISNELWKQVSVLATFRALPANPKQDAPNLSLVHLSSAGSNQIHDHPLYTDTDITITTSTGIHGPQIAEWVILTGLAQSHHMRKLYDLQDKHQWKGPTGGQYPPVRDKAGQRIGILGYGSIGRQVGRLANALGMEVLAYTATPKESQESRRDTGFIVPGTGDADGEYPTEWYSGLDKKSLNHFLAQDIDWLVVSVPLTPQTQHFLGKTEFESLSQGGKKPAFISNIARGAIINQTEMISALKDGLLSGAALDVTDPEPLPETSELWDLPNVTITPHVSGATEAYFERSFQVLELNLQRRDAGEKLVNVVDRRRGY
ncbi:hypothetical protein AMS68_001892 [Peltaster fructicola]|uniref:D-isomer specific 2-hydroxyacid dehydrogenase NAD-binding domain-containing protein n=1 Tax=Peltaster fructicola TaxID=286661 RepID=A0A6H0XP19_9PEZI|nr:hypothetical protein AMS68_001892 [Peltaster fructicola]